MRSDPIDLPNHASAPERVSVHDRRSETAPAGTAHEGVTGEAASHPPGRFDIVHECSTSQAAKRHKFDSTFHCPELQSAKNTAAPNHGFLQLAVDTIALSLRTPENRRVT
jgi:hypothetical protein